MKRFKIVWNLAFSILLVGFSVYALMDTFFISRVIAVVENEETASADAGVSAQPPAEPMRTAEVRTERDSEGTDGGEAVITESSYTDGHISITITEQVENDTVIHIADVVVDDPSYLKTAFAQNAFGRHVTEKTSDIAEAAGAILAVNGDYYGAQEKGYVIRNGVVYRDTSVEGKEDLAIYSDGSFAIINESETDAQELADSGVVHLLSFGPALIVNGSVSVTENDEVARARTSNPRTAIGICGDGHYVFVVSDGRSEESEGLSLYDLADFMERLGCETAYNLDGGGSSTMYFNGQVINNPTGGGHGSRSGERAISDIVYIGY